MRNQAIRAAGSDGSDGSALRVEFLWLGDRFGHMISVVESTGKVQPILESVEGAADDAWPPSPPLQSLRVETLPGGRRAALLVGMAGRSHWSASVEAPPGEAAFVFDLACRHSARPAHLGSLYRLLVDPVDLGSSQQRVTLPAHCAMVEMAVAPGSGRLIACGQMQPATLAIEPLGGSQTGTARWDYRVALTPAAG
jgi:hypothetical protein